jgi:hypothetical protein
MVSAEKIAGNKIGDLEKKVLQRDETIPKFGAETAHLPETMFTNDETPGRQNSGSQGSSAVLDHS